MFYMYILQSEKNGYFYIGSTKEISVRLSQHNSGMTISTRNRRPWKLIYSETFDTLSEARKREQQIKSWKSPTYMIKMLGIR